MEDWSDPEYKSAGSQLDRNGYYDCLCVVEGLGDGEGCLARREQGRERKYVFNLSCVLSAVSPDGPVKSYGQLQMAKLNGLFFPHRVAMQDHRVTHQTSNLARLKAKAYGFRRGSNRAALGTLTTLLEHQSVKTLTRLFRISQKRKILNKTPQMQSRKAVVRRACLQP